MNDLLDLLGSLWGFMLVVTLLAVAAGWSWADIKARPRWRILEDERRYLRNELFGLANSKGATGELGGVRKRIADLEQALAEARGRSVEVEVLRLRIAELERAASGSPGGHPQDVAALDITDYAARIAALEEEANHLRAGRLTPAEAAKLDAERNRLFALEEELEDTQGKLAAAEARVRQFEAAPPSAPPEEMQLLNWRIRYMGERVKYLEAEAAKPAPEPVAAPAPAVVAEPLMASSAKSPEDQAAEKERSDRLAWRMRYLEQRTLYLEKRPPVEDGARVADLERQLAAVSARAPTLEGETASLKARIVDLERQLARVPSLEEQVAAGHAHAQRADELAQRLALVEGQSQSFGELEHDVTRARWKGRYLEARVRYLEGKLTAPVIAPVATQPAPVVAPAPKPADKPATPAEKPAPATPFRMERPAALSAPRGGAPDDLRLIKGVTAQAQGALNALGVFHFDQLAAWRPAHAAWVDQYLNLRGRIGAERWVEQASALARGESVLENQAS
jgi:predicted flap endonuclease-1-like 5' DNA nuclease